MNRESINKKLVPHSVITIFTGNGEYSSDYYLEIRPVKSLKGKPTLMAAEPMPEKILKDIAAAYQKKAVLDMSYSGLMPGNILFASVVKATSYVMWFQPAMERSLNFAKHLGIKTKHVVAMCPALLFFTNGRDLFIFALESDKRPDKSTKLYHAPFFNVYTDARVCLGSANVGARTPHFDKEAERFELGFFLAEQNAGHNNQFEKPLNQIWNSVLAKKQPFPVTKLLKQHSKHKTVGQLIQNLINE